MVLDARQEHATQVAAALASAAFIVRLEPAAQSATSAVGLTSATAASTAALAVGGQPVVLTGRSVYEVDASGQFVAHTLRDLSLGGRLLLARGRHGLLAEGLLGRLGGRRVAGVRLGLGRRVGPRGRCGKTGPRHDRFGGVISSHVAWGACW